MKNECMTKISVIDAQTAGISGDMLLAALIDAGASVDVIREVLNFIPQSYPKCKAIQLQVKAMETHGFRASGVELIISEDEKETQAEEFEKATERIAKASRISSKAALFATNSVGELVNVESRLHGVQLKQTHLHEAGSSDTLGDIFGVAAACDALGLFDGMIFCTPVAVGGGTVDFSHGTLAVPAPAVLEIAKQRGIPIVGGPENVELATPTGMVMLANLVNSFVDRYPPIVPEAVGHGGGKKKLIRAPNLVRVVIGHDSESPFSTDTVQILETNLDDLPGEILGHTVQRLLDGGAKDAWITSAQFKKNRPGHVLHVICELQDLEKLADIMMEETGTLGVRYQHWNRFILTRELKTIQVEIAGRKFDVRVKFARQRSGKFMNIKPEFEDVQKLANELSMPARKVAELALDQAKKEEDAGTAGTAEA